MRDFPQTSEVWAEVEAGLSTDPATHLNTAQEACGRFAGDRGRLALVVRHQDGSRERWTYHELDGASAKAARMLADAGLRPGDRVASLLSRQVESWILALAAWRSGLVYVPLFTKFGADALAYRLAASAARLVVVDHRQRDLLTTAMASANTDAHVVTVTGPRDAGLASGDRSFWAELDRAAADGPTVSTAASDAATLLFTSGTTGEPKSCLMPHSSLLSVIPFAKYSLGVSARSMLFSTADPAWAYGLYTTGAAPMALGVPRVMYSGDFDPAAWRRVMGEERVTCIAAAPSAYRKLVTAVQRDGVPEHLVGAAAAGEQLDAAVANQWSDLGAPPIRDGYGLSEVGMVLADLASDKPEPGTLSGPVPGFEVRVVTRDGTPVADAEDGLIAIHQPRYQMSIGYENRPETWRARWRGDLFVTEDRARREPDGRWRFLGREDDIIVTSGYNVSPAEVERVLSEHPGVAEAAAVAAPGRHGGTVVRAVIVRHDPATPTAELEQQLRAEVARRVGAYAAPRIFDYVDALPRTEVGKLLRSVLRNQSSGSKP